jgi:hypothetical protein
MTDARDIAEGLTEAQRGIVDRLRRQAYPIMSDTASMQLGLGVVTEADDRDDLEAVLDEAADEIERIGRAVAAELEGE